MRRALVRRHLTVGLLATLLGFALSRVGFSDFGEVHRMFTFASPRLALTFAGAVVTVGLGLLFLAPFAGGRRMPYQPLHKGTLPGSVLFGVGWALCGACPAVPPVQLGEGRLPALFTIGGLVLGTLLFKVLNARILKWHVGSCG